MSLKLTEIENLILEYLQHEPLKSSKEIYEELNLSISYATTKRYIQNLIEDYLIEVEGKGKGTKYKISQTYTISKPINMDDYYLQDVDNRNIIENYNFELISKTLPKVKLFTHDEIEQLNNLQSNFKKNIAGMSPVLYQKEMERLAIDLSWKSSQIEGNTYSLLETERLLKEKLTASGKTQAEAIMLLNHKEAIDFIVENPDHLFPMSVSRIEDIHSLLIKDLEVNRNIRSHRVGISGTNYKPLDNEHQIKEALNSMCDLVNSTSNIFEKSLLLLLLISYIQPFDDGNKRTARIISNACLIHHGYCPISFRTIDSVEYKKAMLLFYEQNNISAFKGIFMDQFEFAVKTYF